MAHNNKLKLIGIKNIIRGIRDSFIFALGLLLFFWVVTLLSDDYSFNYNFFTTGSDDLEYLNASVQAVKDITQSDFSDLINKHFYFSLHSLGYPVVLYFLFNLTFATLFTGILLNGFLLWIIIRIVASMPTLRESKAYHFLTVFALCPGLLLVSLHLYKDLFLLVLILISVVSFKNKNYLLAFFFALLTHYFRPFNWILLFISFLAITKPRIIIYVIFTSVLVLFFNVELFDLNNLYSQIELAQSIAVRDMQSYGSTYEPTGNFTLDYLIGLLRFIFLPLPFSINWTNRPLIFSVLDFLQSMIIYLAFFMSVCLPRRALDSIKNNSAIFIYTFLQISTYSLIYFGNGESRYRVFIYICAAIIVIDLSRNLRKTGNR